MRGAVRVVRFTPVWRGGETRRQAADPRAAAPGEVAFPGRRWGRRLRSEVVGVSGVPRELPACLVTEMSVRSQPALAQGPGRFTAHAGRPGAALRVAALKSAGCTPVSPDPTVALPAAHLCRQQPSVLPDSTLSLGSTGCSHFRTQSLGVLGSRAGLHTGHSLGCREPSSRQLRCPGSSGCWGRSGPLGVSSRDSHSHLRKLCPGSHQLCCFV